MGFKAKGLDFEGISIRSVSVGLAGMKRRSIKGQESRAYLSAGLRVGVALQNVPYHGSVTLFHSPVQGCLVVLNQRPQVVWKNKAAYSDAN